MRWRNPDDRRRGIGDPLDHDDVRRPTPPMVAGPEPEGL